MEDVPADTSGWRGGGSCTGAGGGGGGKWTVTLHPLTAVLEGSARNGRHREGS